MLVSSSAPDLLACARTLDFKQDVRQWLMVSLFATDDALHRAHYDGLVQLVNDVFGWGTS